MVGGGLQPGRKEGPVQVWLGNVDAWDEQDALRRLGADDRARLERLQQQGDRTRFAVRHAALGVVLADQLRPASDAVRVQPGRCAHCGQPHGKPELIPPKLEFNLTHSGPLFGVVVHPTRPVGIDLEGSTSRPVVDLARRFFTAAEHELIHTLPEVEQQLAFARLWARKEAVLKAAGTGLGGGLATFAVLDRGPTELRLPDGGLFTVTDLPVPAGYAGAAAVAGSGIELEVDTSWLRPRRSG